MNSLQIIKSKVSNEGFPVDRDILVKSACSRVQSGKDKVFRCGSLVFTISTDTTIPILHLYSEGAGTSLLKYSRRFMDRVWKETGYRHIVAPILSQKVARLAIRFGWKELKKLPSGHTLYISERPNEFCN